MDTVTLYCQGAFGEPVGVAIVSYNEGRLEVRMADGDILSACSLEQWGYAQLMQYATLPNIRPCPPARST